jgi:hypothetical protein
MTALPPPGGETRDAIRAQPTTATEDYVGLAWYLAHAIARGDVNFDKASAELHGTATPMEQTSIRHAAVVARRERAGSLVARLLDTAEAGARSTRM